MSENEQPGRTEAVAESVAAVDATATEAAAAAGTAGAAEPMPAGAVPGTATAEPALESESAVPPENPSDSPAAVPAPSVPARAVLTKEPADPVTPAEPAAPAPSEGVAKLAFSIMTAAAVLLAVGAVVLGVLWRNSATDLDALRTDQSDREMAAQVAQDYTLRSLTYDYKNLPAFFSGVQTGTSDALRARYDEVHDTLAKIMTDAQVVATGQVAGTSVRAKDNDQYEVLVYATQRTSNIQQAEPVTKPNLLVVTVARSGGEWLVVDYGPKDAGDKAGAGKEGAAK
ncbi:hypothetical protein ABZ319_28880 [Nocardia sp. NPDC005978]|uniref:hypothetical protein n=1 Tax=Nocardia sp. NPDC005978 TaxID=3156725 RepID=UPI0033BBD6AC